MSATQSPKTFAYGANDLGGECECPALAAGFNPVESDLRGMDAVIDRYDDILRNIEGKFDGEVPEEKAKNAWIHALEEISDNKYDDVEAAENVAAYHGWI